MLSVVSYGQTLINSVPYTITSPGTYILADNFTLTASMRTIGIYMQQGGGNQLMRNRVLNCYFGFEAHHQNIITNVIMDG